MEQDCTLIVNAESEEALDQHSDDLFAIAEEADEWGEEVDVDDDTTWEATEVEPCPDDDDQVDLVIPTPVEDTSIGK